MTPTVRGISTFAVFFSVSRPFCRFTLVYEGHFVFCCKEKIEPLDRVMANFKSECQLSSSQSWHMMKNQNFSYSSQR